MEHPCVSTDYERLFLRDVKHTYTATSFVPSSLLSEKSTTTEIVGNVSPEAWLDGGAGTEEPCTEYCTIQTPIRLTTKRSVHPKVRD